jgi:DNA-binding CsgD family transcriptional regulator
MTFGLYFMLRQMGDEPTTLSESVEKAELVRITKRFEKEIKGSYLKRLYDRFPKIQHGDVEDAFDDAVRKTRKKEYASASSAKKAIRKEMEKSLSEINKRKRSTGKSLSCVKSVKAALGDGQSMAELLRRADKILTSQEMKVVRMCSEGKPVRKIAEEIGTSFPTAWRVLNSALDKIRVSHGMKPRHLDRRGKG